jgi:hypothetical protein
MNTRYLRLRDLLFQSEADDREAGLVRKIFVLNCCPWSSHEQQFNTNWVVTLGSRVVISQRIYTGQ